MAVTQEKSDQITNTEAKPFVALNTTDHHGKDRKSFFGFTQSAAAGDAGSLVETIILPAGRVRLYLLNSRFTVSAYGAARTMDLGWLAYKDLDGVAVVADPNGLHDGEDVSGATSFIPGGTVGVTETFLFESQGGVTLTAQVNDDTIPAAATLDGYWAYVVE